LYLKDRQKPLTLLMVTNPRQTFVERVDKPDEVSNNVTNGYILRVTVSSMARSVIEGNMKGTFIEDIFWWWKKRQTETTVLEIETAVGTIKMKTPAETNFERLLKEMGGYEPILEQALLNELDTESVYYDVGSRWGYFTLFSEKIISEGEVHGFDANPKWFHLLQENHQSDAVNLTNCYISDEPADRTITLDQYANDHSIPDVVKIDIEGAECKAIKGMNTLLQTQHPTLFIEVHPEYMSDVGDSPHDLFEFLEGYKIDVAKNHRTDGECWVNIDSIELPTTGDYLIRAKH